MYVEFECIDQNSVGPSIGSFRKNKPFLGLFAQTRQSTFVGVMLRVLRYDVFERVFCGYFFVEV
jgi:hypothetical protein